MKNSTVARLIAKIQTKASENVDSNIIKQKIKLYAQRKKKVADALETDLPEKNAIFKEIVKHVKQEMHHSYGSFQADIKKRNKLLQKVKTENVLKKILLTHKSTKERVDLYETLYDDLFAITGKPKTILDLGCGLNPLSIECMHLDKVHYIASEFNDKDNEFIEKYFDIIKNKKYIVETKKIDLEKEPQKVAIKVDVVFAFKLFDVLSNKAVEEIIKNLKTKYLIASFSTMTLGGKQMVSPRRTSFQKLLRRLNLPYETKRYNNELFYIVSWQ